MSNDMLNLSAIFVIVEQNSLGLKKLFRGKNINQDMKVHTINNFKYIFEIN